VARRPYRPPKRVLPNLARLTGLLRSEARSVEATDGVVQMGLMLGSSPRTVLVGQRLDEQLRLWSLSKPLVAVTLLRDEGADASRLATELRVYLARSLRRSDNCAQRYITLRLQQLTGSIAAAENAIAQMLALSGAHANLAASQTDTLGAACVTSSYEGLPAAYVPLRALLVGTATWTIGDAVHFVHALSDGFDTGAGRTASRIVLGLMHEPKLASVEPGAGDLLATPGWGAGQVFTAPCWRLAYKAGWGGAQAHIPWLGAQIGTISLPHRQTLQFAVAVHPYVQPPDDDPGRTTVPAGIVAMLTTLREQLQADYPGWCD
jgi:hypothetical protein